MRGEELGPLTRQFRVDREHSVDVERVRRGTAAQALVYLTRRDDLLKTSRGQIVALAGGEVFATVDSVDELPPRAELAERARGSATSGIFLKRVVPQDEDDERMDIYQSVVDGLA